MQGSPEGLRGSDVTVKANPEVAAHTWLQTCIRMAQRRWVWPPGQPGAL